MDRHSVDGQRTQPLLGSEDPFGPSSKSQLEIVRGGGDPAFSQVGGGITLPNLDSPFPRELTSMPSG
jgi:hypothetical protein